METVIVYVDEAEWALKQMAPMACSEGAPATRWVLVACPPRMTQRASRWLTHAARRSFRDKWSGAIFDALEPALRQRGHSTVRVVATSPLAELTQDLQRQHAAVHVLDARRPREQPPAGSAFPRTTMAIAGFGAFLTLAAD